jgi:uncharacterized protein (TIGR00725 family)
MDLRLQDGPVLCQGARVFDGWSLNWRAECAQGGGRVVSPEEGLAALSAARRLRGVPVAVVGPRSASPEEAAVAEEVGARIAGAGLVLLTGGRTGAMEAASRGAMQAGGLTIGLLPDTEWTAANDYVAVPLASGIGQARNAIIARAALALIAVGGTHGTITEMAFGIHFDRPVFALPLAPEVPGAVRCATPADAVGRVARHILGMS